jgi:predicted nuclease of predicted toxin-antitoxin system
MSTSRLCVLPDQGLPRDTADRLRASSIECRHVGEIGMSSASDTEILDYARAIGCIVVTLDADFHPILVVAGMFSLSVIRIRLEGLKGTAIAKIIQDVLNVYAPDLANGCMITVKKHKTTCHQPPAKTETTARPAYNGFLTSNGIGSRKNLLISRYSSALAPFNGRSTPKT